MASRLPMPKFSASKIKSLENLSSASSREASTRKFGNTTAGAVVMNSKPKEEPAKLNGVKSENKKPPLSRAATMASITRGKAVKRLGTTTGPGATEAKRPNITKATTTSTTSVTTARSTRPVLTTKNPVLNRPVARPATTTSTAAAAKPSKWDVKGRLALATDQLASAKNEAKDLKVKNLELIQSNDSLGQEVDTLKNEMDKLKSSMTTYNQLKSDYDTLTEKHEELVRKSEKQEREIARLRDEKEKEAADYEKRIDELERQLSKEKANSTRLKNNLDETTQERDELRQYKEDIQNLVHSMDKERRGLHNAIQELKGNIRVFCRLRPRTPKEAAKSVCAINFTDDCTIQVGKVEGIEVSSCGGKARGNQMEFTFDKVFPSNSTQADIFGELSMLVQQALEGYNVCVFAYGQTGSGKTFTMEGIANSENEGMIPRTVRHIFEEKKQFELLGWEYTIEASFLEIYNEHIVDLLDSQTKTHEIRMVDPKGQDLYVSNLHIQEIHSPEELQQCLVTAQRNRAVAATQSNERSSRSHSVARIRLIGKHAKKEEVCIGNLNLVDLAGSERLKNEEAARTQETKNINKSLANLGNVILALLKKQDHIPYRNSKLTHLLMPSLGGNSKTLMLLNISPLEECYNETLNSLRFASSVNSCKTGTVKKTRIMQSTF